MPHSQSAIPNTAAGVRLTWVCAILSRCLDPDPSKRYRRGLELAEDLDRWRTDRPLAYASEPFWGQIVPRTLRRHRRTMILTAAVFSLAVGLPTMAFVLLSSQRNLEVKAQYKLGRHLDDPDSSTYGFQRSGLRHVTEPDDRTVVETACRALNDYDVLGSGDWRQRDDVRFLPPADRDDIELWLLEQGYRFGRTVENRPELRRSDWKLAREYISRLGASRPLQVYRRLTVASAPNSVMSLPRQRTLSLIVALDPGSIRKSRQPIRATHVGWTSTCWDLRRNGMYPPVPLSLSKSATLRGQRLPRVNPASSILDRWFNVKQLGGPLVITTSCWNCVPILTGGTIERPLPALPSMSLARLPATWNAASSGGPTILCFTACSRAASKNLAILERLTRPTWQFKTLRKKRNGIVRVLSSAQFRARPLASPMTFRISSCSVTLCRGRSGAKRPWRQTARIRYGRRHTESWIFAWGSQMKIGSPSAALWAESDGTMAKSIRTSWRLVHSLQARSARQTSRTWPKSRSAKSWRSTPIISKRG